MTAKYRISHVFPSLTKISILSVLLGSSVLGWGQNLVPNPSFENYSVCPDIDESIESADYWINPTGYTPDYFNSCDDAYVLSGNWFDLNRGVPYNTEGTQVARTGVAYGGLITADIGLNEREYIQVQLISPLVAGTPYRIQFYVSAGDSSMYSCNDIGAFLSVSAVSSVSSQPLPYTPQVESEGTMNSISDTANWVEVKGTFIASGGEQFLTIGNFKDDSSTDTVTYQNSPQWSTYSYHYIDDVSVQSVLGVDELSSAVNILPNPAASWIEVDGGGNEIKNLILFDSIGREVLRKENIGENVKIDLAWLERGNYFIRLTIKSTIIVEKLIIN